MPVSVYMELDGIGTYEEIVNEILSIGPTID